MSGTAVRYSNLGTVPQSGQYEMGFGLNGPCLFQGLCFGGVRLKNCPANLEIHCCNLKTYFQQKNELRHLTSAALSDLT